MKCLSGIKNDYFEYNLLYSTFGKNTIESRKPNHLTSNLIHSGLYELIWHQK